MSDPKDSIGICIAAVRFAEEQRLSIKMRLAGFEFETRPLKELPRFARRRGKRCVFVLAAHGSEELENVTRYVRRFGRTAGVVVCSSEEMTPVPLLHAGADSWVPLDAPSAVLRSHIDAVARRALGAWHDLAALVELNEVEGCLVLCGERIRLRPSELPLVAALVEREGSWLTELELLRRLHPKANESLTSLVRFHIGNIRKSCGRYAICFEASRGHGYRFSLRTLQTLSELERHDA
jgi:DNA-binding response OmpR family regulator